MIQEFQQTFKTQKVDFTRTHTIDSIEGVKMMFKIQEIREIIRLIDQSSINEFTFENEGTIIKLKKNHGASSSEPIQKTGNDQTNQSPAVQMQEKTVESPAAEKQETPKKEVAPQANHDANLVKIESPMVGTFYAAPSPDDPPYVQVGDKVEEDSIVCIVEAMKLFNEIEAEVKGEIVEILVENGQLVEYGQPLFLVKPE